MTLVAALVVAILAGAAKTIVLAPVERASSTVIDRTASILRARLHDRGLDGTVSRNAGTITLRFSKSPTSAEISTLVERGRLEIFDLEGDLVAPSIDRQGNPVASMRPPRARAGTEVVVCGGKASHAFLCPGNADPSRKSYYLIRPLGRLTNRELARRRIRSDIDALGNPIVRLSFTPAGDRAFQVLTRRLYVRGRLRRTAQHFAVVLDGRIVTFPQIDWTDPTLSDGISGGGEITGVTVSEARSTAAILRSQVLPVALRVVR